MFDTICTFPLTSDLFAQAIHPSEPLLAVGLSSGHVESFRLPPIDLDDAARASTTKGCGQIESVWRTRRHKISCRCLSYSLDGSTLYSAGADGIVKAANVVTGQVSSKVAVPVDNKAGDLDAPVLLHSLTPQTLLLATDSSALHVYDLRSFSESKPQSTFYPHEDYISSLTPLPPSEASTSGFSKQWITVGGTTLAVTDIRKGVLSRSSDQDSELLSSAFVDGFSTKGTNVGQKIVVGNGSGVLTLWERGIWDDQDERIVLDRGMEEGAGESIECLAKVPKDIAGNGKILTAGMGSGLIACVQLGPNRVVDVLRHDEIEAVVSIGFGVGGRMISGGGQIVKVWQEKLDAYEQESNSGSDDVENRNGNDKRALSSDSSDSDDDSSDGNRRLPKRSRKKKKRKPAKSSQPSHGMGSFNGLD